MKNLILPIAFAFIGQMNVQASQSGSTDPVNPFKKAENKVEMQTKLSTDIDIRFLTEYLLWGDQKIIVLLKNLNETEFNQSFGELAGSIHSKTAHILSIYEFFIKIIEGDPHQGFPDLSQLSQHELIDKWEDILKKWSVIVVQTEQSELFALPLAGGQRVEARHIFLDALLHTTHHRGQILTFIRLLGKTKEEVHPNDANVDYFRFMFTEHLEMIHPAVKE